MTVSVSTQIHNCGMNTRRACQSYQPKCISAEGIKQSHKQCQLGDTHLDRVSIHPNASFRGGGGYTLGQSVLIKMHARVGDTPWA